jgi:ATP-dependent DNA helicase RecQ
LRKGRKKKDPELSRNFFQVKAKNPSDDESAESRIDYISDHLGIVKEEVINIVNLFVKKRF